MCGRYPCRSIIHDICPYVRPLMYTNKCRIAKYKSKGEGGWGKEPEPLEPRHHHCDFTAKTQERPAGGPTSLLEMVVCHHLPFLGHKLGDHQRARDSLQRPSLEDACDLPGLGRYRAGHSFLLRQQLFLPPFRAAEQHDSGLWPTSLCNLPS